MGLDKNITWLENKKDYLCYKNIIIKIDQKNSNLREFLINRKDRLKIILKDKKKSF